MVVTVWCCGGIMVVVIWMLWRGCCCGSSVSLMPAGRCTDATLASTTCFLKHGSLRCSTDCPYGLMCFLLLRVLHVRLRGPSEASVSLLCLKLPALLWHRPNWFRTVLFAVASGLLAL